MKLNLNWLNSFREEVGWLVVLGLTVLRDNISVYIGPSSKERESREECFWKC